MGKCHFPLLAMLLSVSIFCLCRCATIRHTTQSYEGAACRDTLRKETKLLWERKEQEQPDLLTQLYTQRTQIFKTKMPITHFPVTYTTTSKLVRSSMELRSLPVCQIWCWSMAVRAHDVRLLKSLIPSTVVLDKCKCCTIDDWAWLSLSLPVRLA